MVWDWGVSGLQGLQDFGVYSMTSGLGVSGGFSV